MFDAVWTMPLNFVLCGVIWAIVLGFAVGNYACSLVHRLPRGRLLLDKTPYCGNCGTLLKVKDLFPVVSALLLRHRCRYCKAPFPVSHTWTEILVGLLFVLAFFKFNFTEPFILVGFIGVFLITLAAIEANEGIIMGKVMLCALISGVVYRTLMDATIYNCFEGMLYGVLVGAAGWRKGIRREGHIYVLPKEAQLLTVGGGCVGAKLFIPFMLLFAALAIFFWLIGKIGRKNVPVTVAFGFAVTLIALYGKAVIPLSLI